MDYRKGSSSLPGPSIWAISVMVRGSSFLMTTPGSENRLSWLMTFPSRARVGPWPPGRYPGRYQAVFPAFPYSPQKASVCRK
jgi:hypothetical protein